MDRLAATDSPADAAAKILDACRVRIQANMARRYRTSRGERWIDASGRSSAAFVVETDRTGYNVRLVYRGDDVAPLESIQYGHDEAPGAERLQRWWREKFNRELSPGRALAMNRRIAERGTERHREPQEWVIDPEVEQAVEELRAVLPKSAVSWVRHVLQR